MPVSKLVLALTVALAELALSPAYGQVCFDIDGVGGTVGTGELADNVGAFPNCGGFHCYDAVLQDLSFGTDPPSCEPLLGSCTARVTATVLLAGTSGNVAISSQKWSTVVWQLGGSNAGECGTFNTILQDTLFTSIDVPFACLDPDELGDLGGTYQLLADTCNAVLGGCGHRQVILEVPVTQARLVQELCGVEGPPTDPRDGCTASPAPGSSTGGGGPDTAAEGTNVALRYRAGGVGHPGFPGASDWNTALGRYWSHDAAERIIEDPDEFHVWLLTKEGVFREFTDADTDGLFETVTPSDEYRSLTKVSSGYELRSLDGTIQAFDSQGLWISTADARGNVTAGYYTGSQLTSISFPDGRTETLTYHPGGKLASVTQDGVPGAGGTARVWRYTWSGDDLERIDMPDGTALRFEYQSQDFPGYMTHKILVGSEGKSERIQQAWSLDETGNVEYTWKGAMNRAAPGATEIWYIEYDDPANPTVTTLTDPLGDVSTYTMGLDLNSNKPRVEAIQGACPACGFGGDTMFLYEDSNNPLSPTTIIDGNGHQTVYTYDSATGRRTSMTEAAGELEQRTTSYQYDASFPALIDRIERPGVEGGMRVVDRLHDPTTGLLISATISGNEQTAAGGSAFSLATTNTYHPISGAIESVDPPGYGTDDVVTWEYGANPSRGFLVPESRTDPLIGTTRFEYDAFNRRSAVIDPNGTRTETVYDTMGRVTFTTTCHVAGPAGSCLGAGDLVTENQYNVFGDLERTILPEGNAVEYGYDAVGRLEAIIRKASPAPLGLGDEAERTLYEYDAAGNLTFVRQQRWNDTSWEDASVTHNEWKTRCHVERTTLGAGSANESVTEYEYDCNGNLERSWDPNFPKPAPPSQIYLYDNLDRLKEVRQPWGPGEGVCSETDATGCVVTQYDYDVQDHLIQVIDGEGGVTDYQYSDRDLLTQETSEVSGTTTHRYNEHGQLVETTDARGVVATRIVDELDRLTRIEYPDPEVLVTHTYDDPAVDHSIGRLTAIERAGTKVRYEYDEYGRVTRDGSLVYRYDDNGNRDAVTYPDGTKATYQFDFADRPSSVDLEWPAPASIQNQRVASAAEYEAAGPLAALSLGNGLLETRDFDERYYPDRIRLLGATALLDWDYSVDDVGNPTEIDDGSTPRTYGYQDHQYYLTQGDGPWGTLSWTYDGIGNRLTETRDGGDAQSYVYAANAAGGNSAILQTVQITSSYTYGAAGHLEQVDASGNVVTFDHDDEGRLAKISRALGETATMNYDGRGFLVEAKNGNGYPGIFGDGFETGDFSCWSNAEPAEPPGAACPPRATQLTTATYSSAGVLFGVESWSDGERQRHWIVHLGGRPVGVLTLGDGVGEGELQYLTTDHLGTPAIATSLEGGVDWSGGFEPFGGDWRAGFSDGASENGVFLRFPGQWGDRAWEDASIGARSVFNVHRWYENGTGRYTRLDPQGMIDGPNLYLYVVARPTIFRDPLGLEILICNRKTSFLVGNHAYFWDPRPDHHEPRFCGKGGAEEMGPTRDDCRPIPGSEHNEDRLMECCEGNSASFPFLPGRWDCHDVLELCQLIHLPTGFDPVVAPGERFGLPCDDCAFSDPRFVPEREGILPP